MNKLFSFFKSPPVFLTFLFAIVNLPVLITNGAIMDDWGVIPNNDEIMRGNFIAKGVYFWYCYHKIMLSILPQPVLYKALIIIMYGVCAYLFWFNLKLFNSNINQNLRTLIIAFFIVLPYNTARNTVIDSPYAICMASFFIGITFYNLYLRKGNIFRFFAGILFLFFSYWTSSLLPFVLCISVILSYYYYLEEKSKTLVFSFHELINFIKYYFRKWYNVVLVLSPVIFYLLQSAFIRPDGGYNADGYNKIKVSGLLYSPIYIIQAFYNNLFGIFEQYQVYKDNFFFSLVFLIVLIPFIFYQFKNTLKVEKTSGSISKTLFWTGIILFATGAFPYCVVGKYPSFYDYNTRHQLLLSIGGSLFVTAFIMFFSANRRILIFTILLIVFTSTSVVLQKNYLVYWMKTEAIMFKMKEMKEIKEYSTLRVKDDIPEYNSSDNAEMRFYEWLGFSNKVYGDEKRLYVNEHFISKLKINNETFIENINHRFQSGSDGSGGFKDYKPGNGKNIWLYVTKPVNAPNLRSNIFLFKIIKDYYLNRDQFEKKIKTVLTLEFGPEYNNSELSIDNFPKL